MALEEPGLKVKETAMHDEISYEENLKALEDCLEKLQREDISLEESFKSYQEALGYYKKCMKTLNDLEGRLEEYKEESQTFEKLEIGEES